MTLRKPLLVALAAANLTCAGTLFTAPPGSTLTLIANPDSVPANGGVSALTAFIIEPAGTTVPDGTEVQFFATIGRVEPSVARTKDGAARANFISDSRSGLASVSAISGGAAVAVTTTTPATPAPPAPITGAASATIGITVGGANALRMIVIADPSRITDSRSTHIIATVFDTNGNPMANIPVVFTVESSPFTEFMDSQGHPIFTDNNGRAEDVMRTRRTPPVVGTAVVRATAIASGSPSNTVSVPLLF
jgi:hypothetical protein